MFLTGMILGILIGFLMIKLSAIKKEMNLEAKRFAEDAKETYRFWKEKRKATE